jgi:glycosyltransferase involved in cell wall biosynthesis
MKKPRIAIILPNLNGGGAERVNVNIANSFSLRGYSVDMVLLSATGDLLAELSPKVRLIDLKTKRIRGALLPLMTYIRKRRPDAILVSMWPLTIIALLSRVIAFIPTRMFVVEHTTWSRDPIASSVTGRWIVSTSMRLVFSLASGIITVSKGAADDLSIFAKIERKLITVIYNPIVGIKLSTVNEQLEPYEWWSGSHYRIIAVGNLSKSKNFSLLLMAFYHLRKNINAKLLILGEGSCRPLLEAQAKQLGIESNLFMPGFIKNPSLYFSRANLHVLSSNVEGFGNVIVEALAAGTPVVSTNCKSGPSEILCNGQFGKLVPVGDFLGLAAAMSESLSKSHDLESLKARAQDFSIEKAVDNYEKLLMPKLLDEIKL